MVRQSPISGLSDCWRKQTSQSYRWLRRQLQDRAAHLVQLSQGKRARDLEAGTRTNWLSMSVPRHVGLGRVRTVVVCSVSLLCLPAPAIFSISLEDLSDFPSRCPCCLVEVSLRRRRAPGCPRTICCSRSPFLCVLVASFDGFSELFPVLSFAVPFPSSDFAYVIFVMLKLPYLPVFIAQLTSRSGDFECLLAFSCQFLVWIAFCCRCRTFEHEKG